MGRVVKLFNPVRGTLHKDGMMPPLHIACAFKTLDGSILVGVTCQLLVPSIDHPHMTSQDTVFLAMPQLTTLPLAAQALQHRIYTWDEVFAWYDNSPNGYEFGWATDKALLALRDITF